MRVFIPRFFVVLAFVISLFSAGTVLAGPPLIKTTPSSLSLIDTKTETFSFNGTSGNSGKCYENAEGETFECLFSDGATDLIEYYERERIGWVLTYLKCHKPAVAPYFFRSTTGVWQEVDCPEEE